jgi:uncharacterized protein YecE (DUF72 family)
MGCVGEILYGTSSWSSKGWVGPFYPEGTRPADMLSEYAKAFGTVEADTTYYRVPSAKTVEGWRARTPEGFVLSAKFPRTIVHGGRGPRPDAAIVLAPDMVADEAGRFLEVMSLLGDRCGPLVLQFPYFNRSVFPDRSEFLDRLDHFLGGLPPDFRYAVELRNKGWIDERLTSLLAAHATALVLVDLAYMPHPADLARSLDLLSTDFAYCRLIGDRKQVEAKTKDFDRIVVDQTQRLQRWSGLLSSITERVERVFLYANNHYAGHGPETVRQLVRLVEGAG